MEGVSRGGEPRLAGRQVQHQHHDRGLVGAIWQGPPSLNGEVAVLVGLLLTLKEVAVDVAQQPVLSFTASLTTSGCHTSPDLTSSASRLTPYKEWKISFKPSMQQPSDRYGA
uniref:Putative intermediate peptidase n=1 Tax=Ixodes ricinus TaxID=34613 RepID=A0A0K8R4Q8_IXORI